MIKKLRLKFIVFSMSIVMVMLCVILVLIFSFTKKELEASSIQMMQNIAANPFELNPPDDIAEQVRLPYFTLQVGPDGELEEVDGGYYDLSDAGFLRELVDITASSTEQVGVIEEYRLRFYRTSTPYGRLLVFADISSELGTLESLMRTCIFIGLAGFFGFLAISYIWSGWVVKPVDRAWKQQRRFVADASHELKTPLTVIMTNAELVRNPDYDEKSRRVFFDGILAMSRQMRCLLEQMLELARADDDRSKAAFACVDLSRLVSDSVLPFEPVFFEKGLNLKVQVAEDIFVNGEEGQLRQAFTVFLDNAQKYSREHGTTWVTLQKCKKGRCLLSVADEGEEIPPEEIKNLFVRFYRADKVRSANGSFGLGLSIAESIIRRHNGNIWAESKDGVNTFFVELRCAKRMTGNSVSPGGDENSENSRGRRGRSPAAGSHLATSIPAPKDAALCVTVGNA